MNQEEKKRASIIWYRDLSIDDVPLVGGKNAALGEMVSNLGSLGIAVPDGFAITAGAYNRFLDGAGIRGEIDKILDGLDTGNMRSLQKAGKAVRKLILKAYIPEDLEQQIREAYSAMEARFGANTDVAVRSSATSEDLPSVAAGELALVRVDGKTFFDTVENLYTIVGDSHKTEVLALDNEYKVRWCEIAEMFRHKAEEHSELIEIRTRSGRTITVNAEHSLLVLEKDTFALRTISADEVLRGGKFIIPSVRSVTAGFSSNERDLSLRVADYLEDYPLVESNDRLKIKDSKNYVIQKDFPAQLQINKDLAYFLGLYVAEGSTYQRVRSLTVDISCESHELAVKVGRYLEEIKVPARVNKNVRAHNKVLGALLRRLCGEPLTDIKGKGRSARIKRVPNFVFGQSSDIICAFIRGCFDGDAYISEQEGIDLTVASKLLVGGLSALFQLLGIKVYNGTKNLGGKKYFRLSVPCDQLSLYKERIGFTEHNKQQRLDCAVNNYHKRTKHHDFIDIIPESRYINNELESAAKRGVKTFVKKTAWFCHNCDHQLKKFGSYKTVEGKRMQRFYCPECNRYPSFSQVSSAVIAREVVMEECNDYDEMGRFFPGFTPWNKGNRQMLEVCGRKMFNKIVYNIPDSSSALKKIASSDVIWDEVVSVEKIKYSGYVYDFVVPKVNNFVSGYGGIVTHNTASFAGQQETYLNVSGIGDVLEKTKMCFASLFTDRAISYRKDKGFSNSGIALSVGVQKMVRSDKACSGVAFSIDTETGFDKVVVINSSYGLGEMVVQGKVTPDEFIVFKPTLEQGYKSIITQNMGPKEVKMIYSGNKTKIVPTSLEERDSWSLNRDEVLKLAKWVASVEKYFSQRKGHYQPMDTEWAKDGVTGELFIVQARPETVHAMADKNVFKEYVLKGKGQRLALGAAIGSKIAVGPVRVIRNVSEIEKFQKGEILVTEITDPDWEPIMKIAAAIVTDKGGRTSHAAIVSRELGIPAVVGVGNATRVLRTGQIVTVDCSSGKDGNIFEGKLDFEEIEHKLDQIPETKTKIMLNVGSPDEAFAKHFLPAKGVGLGRLEFIITSHIQIHPNALLNYEKLKADSRDKAKREVVAKIDTLTHGYTNKSEFCVDELTEGIAKIGAAFWPHEVIIRFSDFKTNEYRTLIGGEFYEPVEENPMLGWRGASRYYDPKFKAAFGLECAALKRVREEIGLKNVVPMIPFCRTPEEARKVLDVMKENGLERGKDGLKVYIMCEIPSNILLKDEFFDVCDGMSIGSNDLTQLTLGIDRDSGIVTHIANEKNESVKKLIAEIIASAKEKGKYIGICGQAPSDFPDFAQFLVEKGIQSMSLNPDTIIKTLLAVAEKEGTLTS